MRDDTWLSLMGCVVDHEHAITFCCLSFLLWSLAFFFFSDRVGFSVYRIWVFIYSYAPSLGSEKKKIPAMNCEHIELQKRSFGASTEKHRVSLSGCIWSNNHRGALNSIEPIGLLDDASINQWRFRRSWEFPT